MKKIYTSLLLLCLLIFPLNINAAEANVVIECDKEVVNPGDSISCDLNLNVMQGKVTTFEGIVDIDNNLLSLKNVIINNSIFFGEYKGTNKIGVTTINAIDVGKVTVATLKLDVSSNATYGQNLGFSIKEILLGDDSFEEIPMNTNIVNKGVKVASAYLSSLSISSGNLSPAFDKDVANYSTSVKESQITISASALDSNATITGAGTKDLKVGSNEFKITVTSGNLSKVYTIHITREQEEVVDNRDKDYTLSSLTINGEEITLNQNQFDYSYDVENKVNKVSVVASLNSSKAKFINGSGTQSVDLTEGKNVIQIIVQAENEVRKLYTITINRKSKPAVEPDDKVEDDKDNNTMFGEEDNLAEGPKTGNVIIYLFVLLVIISVPFGIFAYKKYKKNEV